MTTTQTARRKASTRILGLCLGTAAVVALPSAALGADSGAAATIRATIGANGAVQSVHQVSTSGSVSSFAGRLPVTMTITHSSAGG